MAIGFDGCDVHLLTELPSADYGSVIQQWLVVYRDQATKRNETTFYKNLDKDLTKQRKALEQLAKKHFL
ncbi:hypothetical protein [Vibrio sp. qd031]|uniref:hypothetical protein n=1 Tax=Vibrio sp. qd031 TaxID=1603038 RepID=UPI000A0F4AAF|nr:hypothetical protein [Vibrio sp. qd031]